jgi:hypothetical protein
MNTPWIESSQVADHEKQAGPHHSDYHWQAVFACRVGIRSHEQWARLKWGFNALTLFDEFLERQKLFLEAQYSIRNEMRLENPDQQTLAFRYIQRPGEGVWLTILGKIYARTEAEAVRNAAAHYRGIHSTFPYDYQLIPACTRQEFLQFSGQNILEEKENDSWVAQIRRAEIPAVPDRRSPFLQGLWQTGARAHESIWRSLASAPHPVVMNVLLRSTILYEREQTMLLKADREISEIEGGLVNQKTLTTVKEWSTRYTERRLTPWKKFFYLQVHLASNGTLDENLCRIIATSLTLTAGKDSLPGYQVIVAKRDDESIWRKHLSELNLTVSNSRLSLPRLADIADMDEVFAVMRLPYSPPDKGFPDIVFAPAAKD